MAEQSNAADSRYNRLVWFAEGREPLIASVRHSDRPFRTTRLKRAATLEDATSATGGAAAQSPGRPMCGRSPVVTRRIVSPYAITAGVAVLVLDVVLLGITNAALLCPLWMLAILMRLLIRRRDVLAAVVHLAIAASVMMASVMNSRREERLMEEQLRLVETAICRFHEATGKWPKRLESLVPHWIDRLPDTRAIRMLRGPVYIFRDDEPPAFMVGNRIGFWRYWRVRCSHTATQEESVVR
jgi:hypothetical protein